MSMEVKDTTKWNNIVQLVKLRWQIVFERVWLVPFLAMFVADIVMATTRGLHKGGPFLYNYGSLGNLFIVISMAKILSRAWDILIEKEVSVFPGTIQTRYCSRILYDLSEIFFWIAMVTVENIVITIYLQSGILPGCAGVWINLAMFAKKVFILLFAMLFLYSLVVLLVTVKERIGNVAFYVVFAICCVLLLIISQLANVGEIWMHVGDTSYGTVMCFFLIGALLFFGIGFLLARGLKVWRVDHTKGDKVFSSLLIVCFIFGTAFLGVVAVKEEHTPPSATQQTIIKDEKKGKIFVKDTVFSIGKIDLDKLDDSKESSASIIRCGIGVGVQWYSLKEAKEAGVVENDFTVKPGTICSRMVIKNNTLLGKKYGTAFVNQLEYVIEDSKYVLKNRGKSWFTSSYLDYFDTDGIYGDCDVYLIYSDEEKMELPNESFGFASY